MRNKVFRAKVRSFFEHAWYVLPLSLNLLDCNVRKEVNRIPKRVLYMNLGTTRLRGRPRNRWQDEVREDGRIVGGEGWQERVHNREE